MRLIDCFSDVFTFTLHFMDAVEKAGGPVAPRKDGPPPPKPQAKAAPAPAPTGLAALLSTPAAPKVKLATPTEKMPDESATKPRADASRFSFDMVRDSYQRLFVQSQEICQRGHVPQADFDLAKFAVCAWVDEMISCSAWSERMRWPKEELQRVHFQTTNAGEEFYDYLRELTLTQKDVLEVYATCLALGFQGRYFGKYGMDELEGIRLATVRRLLGQSPDAERLGETRKLFPGAYTAKDRSNRGGAKRAIAAMAFLVLAVTPFLLMLVLFLVYSSLLDHELSQYTYPAEVTIDAIQAP